MPILLCVSSTHKPKLGLVARYFFLRLFSNDPIDESAEDLEHDITEEPPKSVNIIDANRKYTQHFVEDALS